MREIATKVGVQPASLYSHFQRKEDVLWHLCEWTAQTSNEVLDRIDEVTATPLERFVVFVHTFVVFHAVSQREAMVTATQWRSLGPERRALAGRFRNRHAARALGYVQGIEAEGLIAVSDAQKATRALLDLIIGVSTWYREPRDGPPQTLADDYVMLTLGTLHFRETSDNLAEVNRIMKWIRDEYVIDVPCRTEHRIRDSVH